jgi:phosphate transport system protein
LARRVFHQELDRLVNEVLGLGREVEACLGTMVEAVENWDADVAGGVVGSDVRFKGRGAEIVEECMVLQVRQAPVARDLRLVHTAQAVINHLVRTGTLCEHICGAIVETADVERDPDLQTTMVLDRLAALAIRDRRSAAAKRASERLRLLNGWPGWKAAISRLRGL